MTEKLGDPAKWALQFSRLPISRVWKVCCSTPADRVAAASRLMVAMATSVRTTLWVPRLWRKFVRSSFSPATMARRARSGGTASSRTTARVASPVAEAARTALPPGRSNPGLAGRER